MPVFQAVSEKFFNPFSCRNKEIYFSCITELIEKSKEIPVLYEADAKNCLTIYLQNSKYAIEAEKLGEDGEIISIVGLPRKRGSKSCGISGLRMDHTQRSGAERGQYCLCVGVLQEAY